MNVPNTLNRRWFLIVGILLALTMLVPSVYLQQQGESLDRMEGKESPVSTGQSLKQSVIAGGGGASAGGSICITASIGQTVVGDSANPPLALNSGFWPGAIPCPFSLSRTSELFGLRGGQSVLKITATDGCGWTAVTDALWITFVTETTGTGNGELAYEVRENFTGIARQASITIGDYNVNLVQNAGSGEECGLSISPSFSSFTESGGAGSINVAASASCAWETKSDVEWITITSGRVGISNGTVTYAIAPNATSAGRKGTITVGGQSFTIKQAGS